MITGSGAWTTALNAETKRPLYVFSIAGLSIYLSSFYNTIASYTNLATPGAGSTTLTSATAVFERWMVGYWVIISAGTNFVAGNYKISSWTSATAVVLTASASPAGAGSSGVGTLSFITGGSSLKPVMMIPQGASQKVDELNGHSSISQMTVNAIDPDGTLKTLAANTAAIGQTCTLKMGFPGLDLTDFVTIHTGTVAKVGRTGEGLMTIQASDLLLSTVNDIFLNGGGPAWADLATSAAGATTVTSSVALFAPWMVNRFLKIKSGTNFVAGNYPILTFNSTTSITLATSPSPSGVGSVGVGVIAYVLGDKLPIPTLGPCILDNGSPISKDNPRYLAGNPIDLLLGVMQNELGVGQSSRPVLVVNTGGGSGTGQAGFGINSLWTLYNISNSATLINPNTYIDITGALALRDGQFAGDWMEFTLTSSQAAKTWAEDQIMKVLGLYWVTKSNGQLSLKSLKHPVPATVTAATVTISDSQIVGIPDIDRWPVINMLRAQVPADDENSKQIPFSWVQQSSLTLYQAPYVHSVTSEGLRIARGASTRLFLLANRIFNRHAFGTPEYTFKTFLKNFVLELGDFFSLTHPLLLDLVAGTLGVTSVLCEVVDRQPNYADGSVTFKVIDTRFIQVASAAYEIALLADAIPNYPAASAPQKAQYQFVSNNSGQYSTGATGNDIY